MSLLDHFGQPALRKQWDQILLQERLPHALLMYGEPGYGILPGALSLANDIFCISPVHGKACRHCAPCHRMQKYIHPDLHFLLPLAGSKSITTDFLEPWREALAVNPWLNVYQWTQFCNAEGKQVDIHKEDIQQVTAELCMESFEGGNKVLIIWMAQFLSREGNRLLKMIEEPPANTYFILVTNQREQILPTIRSRCMQIYFPPVEESEIAKLLTEAYQVEPSAASRIAGQSGNDMSKAFMLAKNSMLNFREELTAWFRILLSRKGNEIASWASKWGAQEKEEQKQFVVYAIDIIRDILRHSSGTVKPHDEGRDMVRYMAEHFHPQLWHGVITSLQAAYEKLSRNANARLLWLSMSIDLKNKMALNSLQHIKT